MSDQKLKPIHPGEVLLEEFIKPMQITPEILAQGIKINLETINKLIRKETPITAEIALRLSRFFGTSPQFWLGLQNDYDLDIAQDQLSKILDKDIQVYSTPNKLMVKINFSAAGLKMYG